MNQFQVAINPTSLPLTYLGYSLLIILICATSLVKVFRNWHLGRYPQGMRMIQGLTGLTVLRLVVFIITYLAWKENPTFTPPLLILDQAASVIGLLILFWLWNFPEPSREVDLPVLGIILLLSVYEILQYFFLPGLANTLTGSLALWKGLSITFLVVGSGLIIIRKPNLWEYGLFMGCILFIGTLMSLLTEEMTPLHLAQLAAYPVLLLLGDRFPIRIESPLDQAPATEERRMVSVDYKILEMVEKLFDEKDPAGILYRVARATAYLILSDLTLVIDTPDEHGKIRIIAGYDLIREEPLQALTLDSRSIPLLSNYIQRGKLLHIPASSTSRDLSHLSKMLQITKPGHLLAAPVHIAGTNKIIGVVLFSPFSNRPWTKADQDYISLLCKLFEAAFAHHLITQNGESDSIKNTIRDLTAQLAELTKDKQTLKQEMAVLSKDHQNLLLDQDILRKKYDKLLRWGNALQRHLAMLVDLSGKESTEALRKYIQVIEGDVKEIKDSEGPSESQEIKKPAEGKASTEKEDPDSSRPANLIEAIHSCLETVQDQIAQKNLSTTLDLPEDAPLLKINHALFQEVLSFLIDNAIEESKQDGEFIIRTQIYQEDKSQHFAHIKVIDHGEGYFPDEVTAILYDNLSTEQQEQLSQVMTNLYVTKNLIENEGGRMWVESKPGGGTTVSLLLAFL
jgi:signal transduction histidine kinase